MKSGLNLKNILVVRIDDNNYKLLLRNKSQDDILKIKRNYKKKCGLNDDINSFVELEED